MTSALAQTLFLPYQVKWLDDDAQIKICAKSRRIGFTWVQSFEDVSDALTLRVHSKPVDVWFTSADLSAAKEYINYCKMWAKAFNVAVVNLGEIVIDEEKDIKALSLEFKNGARINAISSNPSAFRSKGGKVVIDEFAFHKNPSELWKAARPVITWGYPLRIISSLNGTNNLFYHFVQKIKQKKLKWSLHEVTIYDAVNDGLVDKIYDRKTTKEEQIAWLNDLKESCGNETTWRQEYCCVAIDENSAFLTFELINSANQETLFDNLDDIKGDLYIGFDVARHKDLSVISALEKLDSVFYLRKLIELKNVRFREQKAILYDLLKHPKTRRCCIDSTGIGAQLAEDAVIDYKHIAEAITFTNKTKEELAYTLLYTFQDNNIRFPCKEEIVKDLHSLKKMKTSTGVTRFDSDRSETDGHADRFWSFALAIYAGTNKPYEKPEIITKLHRRKGFDDALNLKSLRGFFRGFNI